MAVYFVSKDGNDSAPTTDPGTSGAWTGAYNTFAEAVTAATGNGDTIKVSDEHFEDLAADSIFTFANNVRVIAVDHQNTANTSTQMFDTPATYYIGHGTATANRGITLNGAYKVYLYGLSFNVQGTTGSDNMSINTSDGGHFELEKCYLAHNNQLSGRVFGIGTIAADAQVYTKLKNCILHYGAATTITLLNGKVDFIGGGISGTGTIPTNFLSNATADQTGIDVNFEGFDLSALGSNTVVGTHSSTTGTIRFANCKLGTSAVILGTQTPANKSSISVFLFNCSSGDKHYALEHYDAFGSTLTIGQEVSGAVYCNDNPTYDGTNKCSWKIITTANCSYYTPYSSPWIDKYHSGTSAITPYLEGLKTSAGTASDDTVAQNNEVWANIRYQGTIGFPLAKFDSSDRMPLLGSPDDQTSTKSATTDWTGASTYKSTFKLAGDAITPAEIGCLGIQICVGEPSITVYVDPQIRGT